MQAAASSRWSFIKTALAFALIVFVAYLPISSMLFFLKNDAFTNYFPPKFFMSESLHAGQLPLWNPYFNFGIPQYGDMSCGYWSPITWLIASTVGYNAYSFTIEALFYIFLGGAGIYALTGQLKLVQQVRFISAIAYICCGYNVGHLQHFNWLSGAAFLPWCFTAYWALLHQFSFRNLLKAVLFFYLLAASAHPGITIAAAYFFFGLMLFSFFNNNKVSIKQKLKQFSILHIALISMLFLLSAGMIAGYSDIIPHFVRGEKVSLNDSLLHPATAPSWMSVLLPFATVKNEALFNTDISMRNSYFSIALLLFFLKATFSKKTSLQKFLLAAGLLFMLLSFGGIFKTFAYKFLPLIGFVRLNGEFRIFAILCFILFAAIELDKYIQTKTSDWRSTKFFYGLLEIIVFAVIIIGIYKCISLKESFLYNKATIFAAAGFSNKLKLLIDHISFYDTLWIQGTIQLFVLWFVKLCVKLKNWNLLKRIVVADIIIASLLNIPFTGAGKASVADIQKVINQSPKGFPAPALKPINENNWATKEQNDMAGDWSLYSKQIGTRSEVLYPIVLKNSRHYFEVNEKDASQNFLNKPFLFTTDSSAFISITSFSPNKIDLSVTAEHSTQLVLQQNFYPHWFYNNGTEKKEVNTYAISFMSFPIKQGENKISVSFEPTLIKKMMLLSMIVFLACCAGLIFLPAKRSSLS